MINPVYSNNDSNFNEEEVNQENEFNSLFVNNNRNFNSSMLRSLNFS